MEQMFAQNLQSSFNLHYDIMSQPPQENLHHCSMPIAIFTLPPFSPFPLVSYLSLPSSHRSSHNPTSEEEEYLRSTSEVHSSRCLSSRGSIKLNVVGKLGLFSSEVRVISTLSSIDLDTKNLGGELEDLVLYLAVLL